ncbi:hypothetical protein INQ25_00810, partial [Wolbachia endosymbiont of Rhagoletis cerasi]|nr:hypothetical protein [Wolbachia endosymbiont of Rhagoletis cerasi]
EGAKALANGNFIGLISLYLESNKIGDEGIEALANGSLTKLFYLDLGLDKISNGVSVDSSNEAREHCTFFENQSKAVHPNTLALKLKDALDKLKSQQSNQDSVTDRHASLDTDSDDGSCFSWGTNWSGKEISGVASPAEAESQQLSSAQRELAAKTNELEDVKCQLREKERDLGVVNQRTLQERDSAQRELAAKTNELEGVKYQLREKERDLGVVNQRALQERGSAQRELAAKTKELNGKNKKFSEANTQSIRQGNYASTFFILSGVCAVGVSLTIPYLAICITFAVAASIFLAVGCYCSYKANTALSNVEVKNGVNPAVVEV